MAALTLGCYLPLLSIILIKAFGVTPEYDQKRIAIGAVYGSIFFFLALQSIAYFGNRGLHAAFYALACLYSLTFYFGYTYFYLLYGQLFGEPAVAAMLDTNPRETVEFLTAAMDWKRAATATALTLAPALVLALAYRPPKPAERRPWLGIAVAVIALAMLAFGIASRQTSQYNQLFMLARSTATTLYYKEMAARTQAQMSSADLDGVVGPAEEAATHVLIIGESTTWRHMSLYGYTRDTTPRLNSLRNELLVVRDTCSSRGSTAASLQEFLTFASRENHDALYNQSSLVPIMKAAGFETSWLSNQQMYGKFDNWSAIFSQKADTRTFINKVGWTDGVSLDASLLEPFKAALAGPAKRKFIVLHLLGAHSEYQHRYPPAFARFSGTPLPPLPRALDATEKAVYDTYDNAVLYTDHIVAEIIEATRASGGSATVTFLSDHGEALAEHSPYAGHVDESTVRQVYDIPLMFWLSPSRTAEAGPVLPQLRANLKAPFQTDGLVNTLLDLYGIRHPALDPRRSLASSEFTTGPRFCDGLKTGGEEPVPTLAVNQTAPQ